MMRRIALAAIMVASITGVVALTGIAPTSAQSGPSATRSFDSISVAPEGQLVVTIQATDYGLAGGVTETLPPGFYYVTSSLSPSQVLPGEVNESGQNVRFTLQGDTSFTYTVMASSTPGSYDFSGTLMDFERDNYTVGGATEFRVLDTSMPAATPTADTSMPAATPTADTSMPAATPTAETSMPAATPTAETSMPAATPTAETSMPAATEPAATEPAATEPAATEPVATDPAATEPAPVAPLPPDAGSGLALSPSTGIAAVLVLLVLSGLLGALGATRQRLR